jgi:lysophospholipid acyltransferase (LPLAT)-like uncharacterized protein
VETEKIARREISGLRGMWKHSNDVFTEKSWDTVQIRRPFF